MTAYIIRRLLLLPLILFGISLIVFGMVQSLGSDRLLAAYVNPGLLDKLTPNQLEKIKEKYGLTDPVVMRYLKWLKNTLSGDLGWSVVGKEPVKDAILNRLPWTVELALYSIIPVVFVGVWLGIIAAVNRDKFVDHFVRIFAVIGWSFPDFVFGLVVLMVFYSVLGWFPPGNLSFWAEAVVKSPEFNRYTSLITIDALLNGRFDVFVDALRHLIAPIMTLSWLWWAYLLRITRSSMLEVLTKEYIRTARAKGLAENVVIHKHARKNAMIPVVTVGGAMVIQLFAGTVIVEMVFNRTGMGSFTATAATQLDYASIMASTLFYSLILVVGNLIIDILYAAIDPRIRFS
ncbi:MULTISPECIES: ABC transporter permease [Pseudothermotoga]|uniref:Binding-protein-dependent transport systems inner membrane component n=1 Tax=Pseudothermotoga lettingae (strain ATCC BAA-301 / DSM 14385 / NBRC 107922 / TMO) TaxID=416591 RepID=A8F4Y2_PSELT|nr:MULTISPECIES: ABC transporter permease [Pseudothermotoga]ABV33216.1 binding-protein-dependent transport systems inner membrane component [Pseudothermotoga lettingae TMO]KUK22010.1 MAG: Binding-protein-dependent transport systems inner membrane component [Pseudothermotoga lettingae]MDK2885349.1 peptide/nickel transport system permease protein [Pseudothermotoga sp.]GLI49867.1 peptide ABC transporter permease [Pseudothermotoga lettingae TMO]HBJ81843.1 ABC transporter permease [Pseudothermotoga